MQVRFYRHHTDGRMQCSRTIRIGTALLMLGCLFGAVARASSVDGELEQLEQGALRAAAERAAACVVRIETLGGLEKVGGTAVSSGPTSGVVVSADGYIVSSAFHFIQSPASILVQLPGGQRQPAKIVARDHSRRLVLLKIEVDAPLPVPEPCPKDQIQIGQWAVTVGRSLPGSGYYMSTGIISAKNRIWGKAVQTDANVSPANYGGPLVDIFGRVVGVLVPLSPESSDVVAGAEWYDSGIGFAVPLQDILQRLPQWQAGDLHAGKLGVSLTSQDRYGVPPEIALSRPNSPARDAGLQAGDRILSINGQPTRRYAEMKHVLGPLLAGEQVRLSILRDEQQLEIDVTLTDELQVYQHACLGILPVRRATEQATDALADESAEAETTDDDKTDDKTAQNDNSDGEENAGSNQAGEYLSSACVTVRGVLADTPAAAAGLVAGERIMVVNKTRITNATQLRQLLASHEVGDSLSLTIVEANAEESTDADTPLSRTVQLKLGTLPEAVPDELPPTYPQLPAFEPMPTLGKIEVRLPEEAGKCWAYIPSSYDPRFAHSLLVVLPVPGAKSPAELLDEWRKQCDRQHTILLLPQAKGQRAWLPTESTFIRKTIENLRSTYNIDAQRIALHGKAASGAMAYLTAFRQRDLIRGVSVVQAAFPRRAPPVFNEPLQRLAIHSVIGQKDQRKAKVLTAQAEQLRKLMLPVTIVEADAELDAEGRAEILRWLDSLDRI